jgi:hypothetical protein
VSIGADIKQIPEVPYLQQPFSIAERNDMIPFMTRQRLSVMLLKTTISYHFGCLQGPLGPASCPLPELGCYIDEHLYGWRIYRLSEEVVIIADCLAESSPKGWWASFIKRAHGVLLRRLGKVRVIYFLGTRASDDSKTFLFGIRTSI